MCYSVYERYFMLDSLHSVPAPPLFEAHCRDAVQNLRGALTALYQAVDADPTLPREVARQFQLDKSLTWKVARVINAKDSFEAIGHIPGASGLQILIRAMADAGADDEAVERVRGAIQAFDAMVEVHTGDRASLELMLDSMGRSPSQRLERSRKLAFKGNSGIWGVQARVRLTCHILAPNPAMPHLLQSGLIGGMLDFRRLRPEQHWPLFRIHHYHDDGTPWEQLGNTTSSATTDGTAEPIGETQPGQPHGLIRAFCSGDMSTIMPVRDEQGTTYLQHGGRVGKTGEVSCVIGQIDRVGVPRYRDEHNTVGELYSTITAPIETLLVDLLVHRSVAETIEPSVSLIGRPTGELDMSPLARTKTALPMSERLSSIGSGPPALASPLMPRYEELVALAFEQGGWDLREFVGLRLVMKHPPMPSSVVVRFDLPESS